MHQQIHFVTRVFQAEIGFAVARHQRETDRDISFCSHTINERDVMVVPDAKEDPRFAENPLVTGEPYIRFYAGAIIHGPQGHAVGTLCVIDHKPRELNAQDLDRLRKFAELVENEIRHVYDVDRLRSSLEYTAYYDILTKLPNRRLLMDRLDRLVELSEKDNRRFLVLLFNIKSMRLINQIHGSETGDEILRQFGERLQSYCPPGGTAARLQADECVLVVPAPADDPGYLDTVAEQVRTGLECPFMLNGREQFVDVQIGGAVFPEHGGTSSPLLSRAAAAIRMPAGESPSTVRFMSQEDELGITRRMNIESRLKHALERQELRLHYQPVISLDDGDISGFEGLLRWQDEELGDVSPATFIPIADESRIIIPLGQWVIEEACRQLAEWQERSLMEVPVAINVEAAQLQSENFAIHVLDTIEAANIRTRLLRIEVTEVSMVQDSQVIAENMATLHDAGIEFLIDDFGTGYSSLEYLRRMPASCIKIDRSFVDGLPDNQHDVALTRTMIAMAKSLEMKTVAEGIETRAQLDHLKKVGCDFGQGYLLARPMLAADIGKLPGNLFAHLPERDMPSRVHH